MRELHTDKVLEVIKEVGATFGELCGAFLVSKGESYRRFRAMAKMRSSRTNTEQEDLDRRHFSVFLYRLKKQGFIKSDPKKDKSFFLTTRGNRKLIELRKQRAHALPKTTYLPIPSSEVVIVMFDVPEREREKRQWIRLSLRAMGFTMAQRSVWIGKAKIPSAFLADLRRLRLVRYVEIFSVNRQGSLQRQLQ